MAGDSVVAGVFALRREDDVEAGLFRGTRDAAGRGLPDSRNGDDDFFGGAGVGGAFEDDELAVVHVRSDGLNGADRRS